MRMLLDRGAGVGFTTLFVEVPFVADADAVSGPKDNRRRIVFDIR